jgi:group I intron endonuclease
MYGVIYSIRHVDSGKLYIGQTTLTNPTKRFTEHKAYARAGSTKHPLYHAMLKYGLDRFEFLIVDEASNQADLDSLEIFYIDRFETSAPSGYNLRLGGGSGGKLSEAAKEQIRQAWSNPLIRDRFLSSKRSDAARQRFSEAAKLAWSDPEMRLRRVAKARDPEVNAKRSATLRKTLSTDEAKLIKRRIRLGTRYITNGVENRVVKSSDSIPNGWRYGKVYVNETGRSSTALAVSLRHSNTKWITDGTNNERIKAVDALPNGWRYGKTNRGKGNVNVYGN